MVGSSPSIVICELSPNCGMFRMTYFSHTEDEIQLLYHSSNMIPVNIEFVCII